MPFMDRDSFIALLERLGDSDDASSLAAAREIHRRMQAAKLKWSDLLVPAEGGGDTGGEDRPLDGGAASASEDYTLVDRILARGDLSQDTRDELAGLRADIGSGEFSARDRKYLQSLETRLGRQT